jgi:glycosyltransferase involved in cell wall biosynthesis
LLRIAHLVPALVKGGGERAAADLANWQVGQGHKVTMIAGRFADERLLRANLDPRIEVRYLSRRPGRLGHYLAGPIWLFKNRRWLSGFDLIHGHLSFSAAMLTLLYFWRWLIGWQRPALIETYHAVGMPIPRYAKAAHRAMAKCRDGFVLMAIDGHWRDFNASYPKLRVEVIPNGLALSAALPRTDPRVRFYGKEAGLPTGDMLVVGNIGRLVAERRPDLLAATLCRIGHFAPRPIHFLVAGEGPERDAIERLFADAALADRIHLPGLAMDPAVPISLMDLYVSLNVGPVTGLAGLEAVQRGVPVIAIQLDQQYATGATDWIWSDQSVEKVAAEALRLLNDSNARRELSRRQKEYGRAFFSIEAMGQAYASLYTDMLSERSGRS